MIGILFGLGAAVFYASVVLFNKSIRHVSGINRTFYQFLAVHFGSHSLCVPDRRIPSFGNGCTWGCKPSGVGVFHTGICYCMYFSSLRYLKGQEASILSYIDPLAAILVSVAILHESITVFQAVGGE